MIELSVFAPFLHAVCGLPAIDNAIIRKTFFDLDCVATVVELIEKACSQILRVASDTFRLRRVPIRQIAALALCTDCPVVAIPAHDVLTDYLTIDDVDAVSDLSTQHYVAFVLDGGLDDAAFNLKHAILTVCWTALNVANGSQFRALLKIGLLHPLLERMQPNDTASVRAFLDVAARACESGCLEASGN
jgi:hypothetical protein